MKELFLVSGSRAEYGQLRPLLMRLQTLKNIRLTFVITGSHLDATLGNTQDEISNDLKHINVKIDRIPLKHYGDSRKDMAISTGEAITVFANYLAFKKPDLLILIGDRYEMFSFSVAASLQAIPIAHIAGGSTTMGAMDEFLRHSISKMSYYHFTTCDIYRKRVIQLGEDPNRVYNVGSLAIENILNIKLLTRDELCQDLSLNVDSPFCVVTFHPVTLDYDTAEHQLKELIQAMDVNSQYNYIITLANADAGSRRINEIWREEGKLRGNWTIVPSLGSKRYLSTLKYSEMMIGNSSSGTTEGPAMKIPTINIGDRQKGRIMVESILNCKPIKSDILRVMDIAKTQEFKNIVKETISPFGDGTTSEKISKIISGLVQNRKMEVKKQFFDISF